MALNSKELHYRYVISYLVVAVIALVVIAYYDVPGLVDKFSFALTMSSLLLAILAIFYTIISSNKQQEQLAEISKTHSEVRASADEVRMVSKSVNERLAEIPRHFEVVREKIDSLKSGFDRLPPESTPVENGKTDPQKIELNIDKDTLRRMFVRLPFTAMGVLYLFTQAYLKDKSIKPKYFEEIGLNSFNYGVGFLYGFQTTGLIDFKIDQVGMLPELAIIPTACDILMVDELPSVHP